MKQEKKLCLNDVCNGAVLLGSGDHIHSLRAKAQNLFGKAYIIETEYGQKGFSEVIRKTYSATFKATAQEQEDAPTWLLMDEAYKLASGVFNSMAGKLWEDYKKNEEASK